MGVGWGREKGAGAGSYCEGHREVGLRVGVRCA